MPEGMAWGMPRSVTQLARTRLLSPIGKARDDATIVERVLEALRAILPLLAPRCFDVERFAVGAAWGGPGIAGCVRGATEAAAAITARWSYPRPLVSGAGRRYR